MNYRTYRTLVAIAVLLLVGVAAPASLGEQSLLSKAEHADSAAFLNQRAEFGAVAVQPATRENMLAPSVEPQSSQSMYTHVALMAVNRKYVAAEGGGGRELVANRDALGPWESFNVVHLGNDRLALQASNGKYVSATGPNGTLLANRDCIGPTETFLMVRVRESRIALKASNGKFVCAEGGGGRELIANRDVAGEWESFYMFPW